MDNSELIETARQYLKWQSYLPSHREPLLKLVRAAIAENTGTSEQKQQFIVLENELSASPLPSAVSFPGSSARSF